jgi:hypothetical protein
MAPQLRERARQQDRREALPPVGRTDEEEAQSAHAANLFDIRRLIGGLFALYGAILLVLGIAGSYTVKHKADGINIDLWTGIGMLLFAAFMIAWALLRPVQPEPEQTRGQGSGRIRRAPAT